MGRSVLIAACCGAIEKPPQLTSGLYSGGRQSLIALAHALDDRMLVGAGHEERHGSAARDRRKGQRNARFRFGADDRSNPGRLLVEHAGTGKEGRGMTVGT